jgi:hypothetical protein
VTVSRHWFMFMARNQKRYLERVQRAARGENGSEVARAKTTLAAFGIGYLSPLFVVKRGRFRYEVVTHA